MKKRLLFLLGEKMERIYKEEVDFLFTFFRKQLMILKLLNVGWLVVEFLAIITLWKMFYGDNNDYTQYIYSIIILSLLIVVTEIFTKIKMEKIFVELPQNKKDLISLRAAKKLILKNIDGVIKILKTGEAMLGYPAYSFNQCNEYIDELIKIKEELEINPYTNFLLYYQALTDKDFNEKTVFKHISRKRFSHGLFV